MGEVLVQETFADADTDFVIDSGELRGKSISEYDNLGRAFQSSVYEVDPTTGALGDRLTSRTWFNERGMTVKAANANGLFQKLTYDGAGRVLAAYTSFDDSETSYADALNVDWDTVVEQSQSIYNRNGQVVTALSFSRLEDDTSSTGALTTTNSYVQVGVNWFDQIGRQTASATYGRDDGATRYVIDAYGDLIDSDSDGLPDEAEGTPRSVNTNDDYLVSAVEYDAAGRAYRSIDNKGKITQRVFDLAGRTTKVIENYVNGVASETETDTDRITETVYDTSGRVAELIAYNPQGSGNGVQSQSTKYLYNSAVNKSWVTSAIYPDSFDTNSSGTDQVKTTHDRLGRAATSTDQRGVVHTYGYDAAGRLETDAVTSLGGSGVVDGSVRRIEYGYDDLSHVNLLTSYDAASTGNVVNQVKSTFDGWGIVVLSEQEHDGAVDGSTPAVEYTYDTGASGGEAKYVRLSKVTYPNGREVAYNLATDDVGAHLVRTDNIADDDSGTTKYAQYTYLGAGTITSITHPAITSGLTLSYGASGTYNGWDRFGRIVDQSWTNDSDDSLDRFTYTYDRNSNRLSRTLGADGAPTTYDEVYSYDGLDRLVDVDRNGSDFQAWTLDSLGNWRSFVEGATTQTRTHNAANEITGISGNTPTWATTTYDAAGNQTSGPKTQDEDTRLHKTYDGWNRLVGVFADSSGTPGTQLLTYEYDARGYRIERIEDPNGTPVTDDTYYNEGWQVLEVRRDGDADPREQWVWDTRYIDAPVVRFLDGNTDGDYADGSDNTLYSSQDANFNVTALIDAGTGDVVERYAYDPYGKVTVMDEDFSTDSDNTSDVDWNVLFQGLRRDGATNDDYARNREYGASVGVWGNRDPIGYEDGMNIYMAFDADPISLTDSVGLAAAEPNTPGAYALDKKMSQTLKGDHGTWKVDWRGFWDEKAENRYLKAAIEYTPSEPISKCDKIDILRTGEHGSMRRRPLRKKRRCG